MKTTNPLTNKYCGENRFVGIVNKFQFYITPGCLLSIKPLDAISSSVRMEWTLSQYYADGGSTTFSDRLASSLGIKPQDIKVVSVYQGSVVVVYAIENTPNVEKAGGLQTI